MQTSIRQLINSCHALPLEEIQPYIQASIITPDNTGINDIPNVIDLFLAGGITDCWNWQKPLAALISHYLSVATPLTWLIDNPGFTIAIPRRESDFSHDGSEAVSQICWEHKALSRSVNKSYYFTRDAMQPISLLELGKHLANPVNLFIAIEYGYARHLDVRVQTDLALRQSGKLGSHYVTEDYDDTPPHFPATGATVIIGFDRNQRQQDQDIYLHLSAYAKMVAVHMLRQRGLDPMPVFDAE